MTLLAAIPARFPRARNCWPWARPTRPSCRKGPLFDFAPAIDQYLKTHLFGDIFARDNLDWQIRELATVGALAAMPDVESQLQSHIRISMNVGLSAAQLRQLAQGLAQQGEADAAARTQAALDKQLAEGAKR